MRNIKNLTCLSGWTTKNVLVSSKLEDRYPNVLRKDWLFLAWENIVAGVTKLNSLSCIFSWCRSWRLMSTSQSNATSVAGMWWPGVPLNGCPLTSQRLCVNGFYIEVGGAGSRFIDPPSLDLVATQAGTCSHVHWFLITWLLGMLIHSDYF